MEKLNTKRTNSSKRTDLKASSINLFLNISIFLLVVVISYMLYSIYLKVSVNHNSVDEQNNGQAAADIIQVEVMNGCGIAGIGDRFTDFLRANKFDVVKIGNYISFDVDECLVIDRTGNMANAYKVAKALGIKSENVIQQLNKDYFLDVSLIVGKDYFKLVPFK